ncbi:MAG: hypothetical protein IPO27_00955 [Bacteroidetes bacterium]|nr:hypothetical protein [Bacteroidota bacterium]
MQWCIQWNNQHQPASGGTTPYGYVWSNGSTIQNQTGLAAGTYTVTVTDANGCTATESQTVTQPTTVNAVVNSFTNIGCNGGTTGTISITTTGGTTPPPPPAPPPESLQLFVEQ